jgi:hypothetical protein
MRELFILIGKGTVDAMGLFSTAIRFPQLDIGARLPSHACRPGRLLNLFLSFFDSGAVPRRNAVWNKKPSGSTEMSRVF